MRKKLLYIVLLTMMMLTACGKPETDKKDSVKSEKEESQEDSQDQQEVTSSEDETTDTTQVDEGKTTSTEKETVSASENKETSNNEQKTTDTTEQTTSNNTGSNTQKPSSGSTTTKPSTGSNTGGSTNTGGSNNSGNTGGSSTTTTKKPVKRVSEEVKSAVVPYKYGITKYDVTTNYYTLYSDGSKEFLNSDSYTVYDSSNYSATDGQLKSESDSNASKYMSYYQEVLRLVNEIRAEAGVAPLTLDTTLCKAASMRALEMDYGNEMSHTRPSGTDCFSVLDFYGASYGACGENIAAGQTSAASVVKDWKSSPGHYQNMINASFTKLGVGYSAMSIGDYGHYWCQLFTN